MIRVILKDSLIYAIPALISRGISILLVPLYTRVLTTADYGSFDLLLAFSGLLILVVPLEVSQGLARFYAGTESARAKVSYASSAFWFTAFCYMVFSTAAFTFAEYLSDLVMGRPGLTDVFMLGVVYIVLNAFFSLLQNQFRWEFKGKNFAIASLIYSLFSAFGAVCFAYFMNLGLLGLVLGLVLGAFFGSIYGLWKLRASFRFQFDMAKLVEMLKFSLPLVPSGIAIIANVYIDRFMVNYLLGIDEVGLFGVGVRVASIVGLVMVGFQGAVTPLIYANHQKIETAGHLAVIFRYFCVFALLLCVGVSLFAGTILEIMTTPDYYGASTTVAFLAPAVLLAQMYIFAPGISIVKKTHIMIWINIGGLFISASLNWLLIPLFGIEGAAFSTLFSCFVVFSTFMIFSQRYYFVPHVWSCVFASCLLCGALVAFVLQLELAAWERWLVNSVSLCFICIAFIGLGMVRTDEVRQAKCVLGNYLNTVRVKG